MDIAATRTEKIEMVEELVDHFGMPQLLDLLSEVCYLKRDHLLDNWQDKTTAMYWGHLAAKLEYVKNIYAD